MKEQVALSPIESKLDTQRKAAWAEYERLKPIFKYVVETISEESEFQHFSFFYRLDSEKLRGQGFSCSTLGSSCSGVPAVLQYERDHWGIPYVYIWCNSCAPSVIY